MKFEKGSLASAEIYLDESGTHISLSGELVHIYLLWSVFTRQFCKLTHIHPEELAAILPEAVQNIEKSLLSETSTDIQLPL